MIALMRFIRSAVVTLVVVLIAQVAPASQLSSADLAAVRAVDFKYAGAWRSNDRAAVLSLFAPDAVIMPEARPPIAGLQQIADFWWPSGGRGTTSITSFDDEITEAGGSGDFAFTRGTYHLTFSIDGASSGSYMMLFHKSGSAWKITHRMWVAAVPHFVLHSSAFADGATMPDSTVLKGLDCAGANISPALDWTRAPAKTQSFALVMDDYEARGGDGFVHWSMYNIPSTVSSIPANAGASHGDVAGIGRHAYNDFLQRSYGGPCPPEGPAHKYRFTIYALDLPTIDDAGTPMTWRKLRFIIHDHTLGDASLTGLRGH